MSLMCLLCECECVKIISYVFPVACGACSVVGGECKSACFADIEIQYFFNIQEAFLEIAFYYASNVRKQYPMFMKFEESKMLRFSMIAKVAAMSAMTVFVGMSANAADRISDFSLTDSDGRFFQLSRHGDEQAVVLFTFDPKSRDARRAAADLADVAEHRGLGVEVVEEVVAHSQAGLGQGHHFSELCG